MNIPTELLRTLVSVVDQRSFTKAAHSLGVTQPAVSAQVKRLQFLLGYEILDKSAPGVSLTPRGDTNRGNPTALVPLCRHTGHDVDAPASLIGRPEAGVLSDPYATRDAPEPSCKQH